MSDKGNGGIVRGFKVFGPDWSCSPKGNKKQYACPGKFEEDVDLEVCESGMHFCENAADCFNYYDFNSSNKVAEVIAYGKVVKKGDKSCTDKLEIVREIPWEEVLRIVNTGNNCTGYHNSGDCNSGSHNSGDYNSGNYNSGCHNSGDCNSGNYNSGCHNSGDCNSGKCNSGSYNSGDCNSGNYNSGCYNSGDWNRSSFNTGCFSTEDQKIWMFNRESMWTYKDWIVSGARELLERIPKKIAEWIPEADMTEQEKMDNPEYATTGGYLRVVDGAGCAQEWWDGLWEHEKDIIRALPNFNPQIFYECTGIHVESGEAVGETGKEK